MDDGTRLARIEVGQHIAQLTCPRKHLGFGEGTAIARQAFFECFAFHIFHHQKVTVALGEEIGNFGEGGVVEVRQKACLQAKLFGGGLLLCGCGFGVGQEFFDSAGSVAQVELLRLIDGAIAAATEEARDAILVLQDEWRAAVGAESGIGAVGMIAYTAVRHRSPRCRANRVLLK